MALVAKRPQRVLSSALLGGGLGRASAWYNAHVRHDAPLDSDGPAAVLARRAARRGLGHDTVAMMTGAAMSSLRLAAAGLEDARFALLATAGLANARAAGDTAEMRSLHAPVGPAGTINIALVTDAALADAALVESVAIVAEAKAAALCEAGIASPVSGRPATGTGTDATAVFCGTTGASVAYAGKHTLVGETVARLVMTALASSIAGAEEACGVG
ncbi:adenosylcobinamide amidohydrolase [Salinisphaera sp. SPP-AMP-43]|uniref:adenosylcobinamide amidohydrolase n=1 Tax=Salinisphaera sp. SPP-AMP-43 TaxID=3121288 RepID=UPI003C6E7F85